ncbi:glycosyltransferase family 2 protein [Pseudonocardia sp. TRM90224]|uniref:glycosyltransferase family 2 protein n=1 Tax=Pseudonocardia sp. TRM90224 TaxID=2812678 RepID=UPI001E562015|nr:glycosyltransferase family 2 protein [Pseudonocardia sp. TRM90224]
MDAPPSDTAAVAGSRNGKVNDDVWVIIPVYNEAQVLESVIQQVLEVFPNVVCIDDGSHDGSVETVLRTGAHLVRHPVNLGQGAALQTGLSYAKARPGARYFITFDADGQHRLEDASKMLDVARSGEADLVLGTRFAEDAASVPLLKRIVLRTAVLLSPAGRKLKLTDAHNGLRVITRPVADDLQITMNGMAHASEIVSYLGRSSWRVREIPVSIRYTEYSRSKGQSLLNGVNILFDLSVRHRGG